MLSGAGWVSREVDTWSNNNLVTIILVLIIVIVYWPFWGLYRDSRSGPLLDPGGGRGVA